jgi:hypothetical protein
MGVAYSTHRPDDNTSIKNGRDNLQDPYDDDRTVFRLFYVNKTDVLLQSPTARDYGRCISLQM